MVDFQPSENQARGKENQLPITTMVFCPPSCSILSFWILQQDSASGGGILGTIKLSSLLQADTVRETPTREKGGWFSTDFPSICPPEFLLILIEERGGGKEMGMMIIDWSHPAIIRPKFSLLESIREQKPPWPETPERSVVSSWSIVSGTTTSLRFMPIHLGQLSSNFLGEGSLVRRLWEL